jgi:type I restriction enzyme M protein
MEQGQLSWIANFIWGIADDVLRDLYVRGKYRDVILPMMVLRRLDAVLEPTKKAVLDLKVQLDKAGVANQDPALRQAAGQAFYNTSPYTLRDLRSIAQQQKLRANFEAYLDGFSPNVQDILTNFEFRNQIPRLSKADALGTLRRHPSCSRCRPGLSSLALDHDDQIPRTDEYVGAARTLEDEPLLLRAVCRESRAGFSDDQGVACQEAAALLHGVR